MEHDSLNHVKQILKDNDTLRDELLHDPGAVDRLPVSEDEKAAVREALAYREEHNLSNVFWG